MTEFQTVYSSFKAFRIGEISSTMNSVLRSTNIDIHQVFKCTIGFLNGGSRHSVVRRISSSMKHDVKLLKTAHHSLELKPLENKEKNWPLLLEAWYHFHENAPTCASVSGFRSLKGREILELCLRDMVLSEDCPVVIAWDTEKKKVAAMIMNHIDRRDELHIPYHERPGTFKYENHVWPEEIQEDITLLERFYEQIVAGKLDFYSRYDVDACWNTSLLTVLPGYSGQSIGLRTKEYGLDIGRRMGLKLAKGICVSAYTQQMLRGIGYKSIFECNYESEFQLFHKMPKQTKERHKSCMAMVKVL